jgi:hypothetical protein
VSGLLPVPRQTEALAVPADGSFAAAVAATFAASETRADPAAADGTAYGLDHLRLEEKAVALGLDGDPAARSLLEAHLRTEVAHLRYLYHR